MYDWNALWHSHASLSRPFDASLKNSDSAPAFAGATLYRAAQDEQDIVVYDGGDHFVLLHPQQGRQLHLAKRDLVDIGIRLVTSDENQALALPYLEVLVDNLATGEAACWRAEVSCNDDGELLAGGELLHPEQPPHMQWPTLSFAGDAAFAAAMQQQWQDSAEEVTMDAAVWFNTEVLEQQHATLPPLDARSQQMCERYAEIIRREQAALSRQFSDPALMLIAEVLRDIQFDSAESCRGLWLAVESRLLQDELDRKHGVDGDALLQQLKNLGYTQEVALIEALSPVIAA